MLAELQFGWVIPTVFHRESIHWHGVIIAAPCLSCCGGGADGTVPQLSLNGQDREADDKAVICAETLRE